MKYVKIKPLIVSGPDMSDMTIAYYTDDNKMSYYDAYQNYIGRTHKCNVVCNLNTAIKFTPKDAKEISKNNTIDFDNSNINLFKSSWGGRGNYLLARAREVVIHSLRPLGLCWVVQEQHLFMDNSERLTGMMLEATIGEPNTVPTTYRLTIKGLNGNMWKHAILNYDLSMIDNSSEKDTVTDIMTYVNKEEIILAIKDLFKDQKMRKVSKDSIASIIKERIDNFELNIDVNETGKVVSYVDGIAEVYGIKNVIAGELVEFENNEKGLVSFVGESNSTVVILGKGDNIKEGMLCNKSLEELTAPNITKSLSVRNDNMNKKNMLTLTATSALAGEYLGDIMLGRNKKTPSDVRCKEKKIAKRRAKNKNKKK